MSDQHQRGYGDQPSAGGDAPETSVPDDKRTPEGAPRAETLPDSDPHPFHSRTRIDPVSERKNPPDDRKETEMKLKELLAAAGT